MTIENPFSPYSFQGYTQADNVTAPFPHAKSGGARERTAYPGTSQGPIDPETLKALVDGAGHLSSQTIDKPRPESPGILRRWRDDQGRYYLTVKFYDPGQGKDVITCIEALESEQPMVVSALVSAASMFPSTTSGATEPQLVEFATSNRNVWLMDFSDSVANNGEFSLPAPDGWDGGTARMQPYWTNTSAAGGTTVSWGLEAWSDGDGASFTDAWGTKESVVDTTQGTNAVSIGEFTPPVTFGGNPFGGRILSFRVSRDPTADDLGVAARLAYVRIELTRYTVTD